MKNKINVNKKDFYFEKTPDGGNLFSISKEIFCRKTKYQLIEIIENPNFGKILFLDNIIQSASKDEFIYHETIVHPAMINHPAPKKVLVIGGGDGYIIREILKHKSVKEINLVDIDEESVKTCDKFLHQEFKLLASPKTKVIFEDGLLFLSKNKKKFDVIIMDLPGIEENSSAEPAYSSKCFKLAFESLKTKGVISVQGEDISFLRRTGNLKIYANVVKYFPFVKSILYSCPSFNATCSVILACKNHDPEKLSKKKAEKRIKRISEKLNYFSYNMYYALFSNIPKYLEKDYKKNFEEKNELLEKNYINPFVYGKKSSIKGNGLYAKTKIKKGTLIVEWGGKTIPIKEWKKLPEKIREYQIQLNSKNFFGITRESEIDEAEFINHSCNPNCGIKEYTKVVALRDIFPEEELTYDYIMTDFFDGYLKCLCGEKNCRRALYPNDYKKAFLQKKTKVFFQNLINRKITNSTKKKPTN